MCLKSLVGSLSRAHARPQHHWLASARAPNCGYLKVKQGCRGLQSLQAAGRTPLTVYASHAQQNSLGKQVLDTCGKLVKWVLRLAAVAALVAAALPSLLSTGPGLKAGTSIASHYLEGDLHIQKADLGWLKPVHLTGVSYNLPLALGGQPLATADRLNTRSRLWDVIVGRQYDVYGEKPWLDCTFSKTGQWKWTELSKYASGKFASRADAASAGNGQSSLVQETTEINFSAEARLLTASVYLPNGVMKVPREVKEVIGKNLHLIAVLGRSGLREAEEEFELDLSWATKEQQSTADGRDSDSGGSSMDEETQPHRLHQDAAAKSRWLGWETHDPGVVQIQSENLRAIAQGWRRRSDSAYLLKDPARLEFSYTSALAEYVLGRLSPLLSGCVAVENGMVGIDVAPNDLTAPAETYHFRIDPLRIAVQKQGLLKNAIDFLRLKRSGLDGSSLLQGATSAIHVQVSEDGLVETQRLDLLISPGRKTKGVHLCSWGSIKPTRDSIDLNLGIPADMLELMGMSGAKKDDVLIVPLKGTVKRPVIDWRGAYSRLSALAASRAGEPTSLRGAILSGVARSIDQKISNPGAKPLQAPQPPEPLPWEDNEEILDNVIEI